MKKLHIAAIALLLFMLNGCAASGYPIAFDSNPRGATVMCGSNNLGYAPAIIYWDMEKMKNSNSPVDFSECSANWVSGAKAKYEGKGPIRELLVAFPDGVVVTANRPNVRGLQQDAEFALKVQTMQAAQRQAAAAESQARAAHDQASAALTQASAAVNQALAVGRPKTCFTNYGMTTCY